jgi:DNA repair protein RecN (Recombination protein N)
LLTSLTIRDVVLIDRLDLSFESGLTVLTGETGAGKSILLDSLGLAIGQRANIGLVRSGAQQASVAAHFLPHHAHPIAKLLTEQGIAPADEHEVVLRRVIGRDGRSRAFINDQPVGLAMLRRAGALLVEIQGQHEQMGLTDPALQTALLDAFGVPHPLRLAVATRWRDWRDAKAALEKARSAQDRDSTDRDWLTHAVGELSKLAPETDEEQRLAVERQRLQQDERRAEAIAAALAELSPPRDRRGGGPAASLRAAARALQRLGPADEAAVPALAALERAEEALAEGENLLSRLAATAEADPRLLEKAEERLFTLRAAARKHGVAVVELPALLAQLRDRLAALQTGEAGIAALEQTSRQAEAAYRIEATRLTDARRIAGGRLQNAVGRELAPLRLDRARFIVALDSVAPEEWGPDGTDSVRFLIATNPGQDPAPLGRIASGGELSRLMLALKVVLAKASPVPTLVFDEVDSGVGGATAAAVGERLAQLASTVQVLVVTHSPQVAARGGAHLQVLKKSAAGQTATLVHPLDHRARREEIARMLAGSTVTEAARAAADSLLGAA